MKARAQSTIEFTIGFIITILFVILTCNLFVWFNNCLVRRQRAYEDSRERAARGYITSDGRAGEPGEFNYRPPTLNIFNSGGR